MFPVGQSLFISTVQPAVSIPCHEQWGAKLSSPKAGVSLCTQELQGSGLDGRGEAASGLLGQPVAGGQVGSGSTMAGGLGEPALPLFLFPPKNFI